MALAALSLALAGCADLPRDPEKTLQIARERGEIRLGMVAGVPRDAEAEAQLAAVASRLNARVEREEGPGEILLGKLERGELDLVYGAFATSSPWSKKVHLGRAPGWLPGTAPKDLEVPRFAMRGGENGWIMAIERAAR